VTSPDARPTDDGEPRAPSEVMIRLAGVHKSFGPKRVLVGVDLEVVRGETFVIVGPSGTGKSCLLKLIVGLMAPEQGEVWLGKQRVDGATRQTLHEVRARVGYLFQSSALFSSLTVGENVGLYLSEHRLKSPSEISRISNEKLEFLGLKNVRDRFPSELSGGMKKRVAIARALVIDPQLILYDEPTSELDPLMTVTIGKEILDLSERIHVTSIVVTHDRDLAFGVADRIAMMNDGNLLAVGIPDEIRHHRDPLIQKFLTADFNLNDKEPA